MNTDYVSMRKMFAEELYKQMAQNKDIYVLTGDLGYIMWDKVRQDYPDRFINVGAAEQALIGLGIGLALENKIPIIYSITTFLLYRPFETIRNYVNHERIPVRLIGSGREKDYKHDGISHWPLEDKAVMSIFTNITPRWPTLEEIPQLVKDIITKNEPWYINLTR